MVKWLPQLHEKVVREMFSISISPREEVSGRLKCMSCQEMFPYLFHVKEAMMLLKEG